MKKLLKQLFMLAMLASVGYGGWYYYQNFMVAEQQEEGLGQILTGAVQVRDITVTVSATGTLQPIRIVQVKSKAAGEIIDMPVESGDHLEAGQLIAQIDTETLEQELAQAEADLESARTRFDIAEKQLERSVELLAQDLISQRDLETNQQNFATSKSQLLRAEADVKLRQERLDDATVRAPVAGTIIKKEVEQGQIITSSISNVSGGATLVEMADLRQLEIRTLVDEIDIGRVRSGLKVDSSVEAYPSMQFSGQVIKIEPQAVIQQQVTTFPVLSRIDNSQGLLLPGMNADVDIVIHSRPGVLSIPNEAVREVRDAIKVAELLGIPLDPDALQRSRWGGLNSFVTGSGTSDARRSERGNADAGAQGSGRTIPDGSGGQLEHADPSVSDGQTVAAAGGTENSSNDDGAANGQGASGGMAAADRPQEAKEPGEIDFSSMGRDEIRKRMQEMSGEERQKMVAQFRARGSDRDRGSSRGGPGGGGDEGDVVLRPMDAGDAFRLTGTLKASVVFIQTPDGGTEVRRIMVGIRDWDYTEVAAGLRDGEQVFLLPSTSLLTSQQEMRERMSSRMGIGGMMGGSRRR